MKADLGLQNVARRGTSPSVSPDNRQNDSKAPAAQLLAIAKCFHQVKHRHQFEGIRQVSGGIYGAVKELLNKVKSLTFYDQ